LISEYFESYYFCRFFPKIELLICVSYCQGVILSPTNGVLFGVHAPMLERIEALKALKAFYSIREQRLETLLRADGLLD